MSEKIIPAYCKSDELTIKRNQYFDSYKKLLCTEFAFYKKVDEIIAPDFKQHILTIQIPEDGKVVFDNTIRGIFLENIFKMTDLESIELLNQKVDIINESNTIRS